MCPIAAVRVAKQLGKDKNVVTVICDSGQRHLSRFWNKDYVGNYGIVWPENNVIPECLRGL